ncbi:MAG: hypothetical protein KIT84_10940 [Labilithrix sp.]|nr:hypothetical protein [Labilithrix sp.]
MRFGLHFFVGIACVAASSGCAHRVLRLSSAEVERVSVEVGSRGEAPVTTEEGVATTLRGDEKVTTVSGELPVHRWIATNCEPSGVCHFDGTGIAVERVDPGASARTAFVIVEAGLVAGAAGAGVTCATGMICDSESSRTAGTIILASASALFVASTIVLLSCKSCWAWR